MPPALEPTKKPALWKLRTVPLCCWWSRAHWGPPATHGGDLLIAAPMSLPLWALVWPRCRDMRAPDLLWPWACPDVCRVPLASAAHRLLLVSPKEATPSCGGRGDGRGQAWRGSGCELSDCRG